MPKLYELDGDLRPFEPPVIQLEPDPEPEPDADPD